MYFEPGPLSVLKMIRKTLNSILDCTGSQCKGLAVGVIFVFWTLLKFWQQHLELREAAWLSFLGGQWRGHCNSQAWMRQMHAWASLSPAQIQKAGFSQRRVALWKRVGGEMSKLFWAQNIHSKQDQAVRCSAPNVNWRASWTTEQSRSPHQQHRLSRIGMTCTVTVFKHCL